MEWRSGCIFFVMRERPPTQVCFSAVHLRLFLSVALAVVVEVALGGCCRHCTLRSLMRSLLVVAVALAVILVSCSFGHSFQLPFWSFLSVVLAFIVKVALAVVGNIALCGL